MEPPRFVGALKPMTMERELRARRGAVKACYLRALRGDPGLRGRVVLRFTVGPAGTATASSIDQDGLGQAEAVACLKMIVARWRFPAPATGSAEVVAPIVFSPTM